MRSAQWAREAGLEVGVPLGRQEEFAHLTFARLLLAEGSIDEVAYFLDRLTADAAPTERADKQIEIGLLRALAFNARRDQAGALAALSDALALAEPGGYVHLFLDEGAPMVALLAKLLRAGRDKQRVPHGAAVSPAYLATLLAAARAGLAGANDPSANTDQHLQVTTQPTLDLLSQREVEIVRRLATGMSNAEIARDLVVAPSTVKWHVHNILEKVGAHSRTGAIARAQVLGLL